MNTFVSSRNRGLIAAFLGAASLCCAFLAANAEVEKKQKCEVCHNVEHNPHTIIISCNAVDHHLANHPGDYAGPCQGVTNEKPPKPKKPPKDTPNAGDSGRWNTPN